MSTQPGNKEMAFPALPFSRLSGDSGRGRHPRHPSQLFDHAAAGGLELGMEDQAGEHGDLRQQKAIGDLVRRGPDHPPHQRAGTQAVASFSTE